MNNYCNCPDIGEGGGMFIRTSNLTIKNCLFYCNTSSMKGGGLFCTESTVQVINCTFQGNSSTLGGAVYIHRSTANLVNTIVEGTTRGLGVYFTLSPNAAVSYGDFHNNGANFGGSIPAGIGVVNSVNANGDSCDAFCNIFLDPLFMNPGQRNFHLTANSPCIDAGNPAMPLDPDSTVCDIGAFFFDQNAAYPGIALSADTLLFPDTWVASTESMPITIYSAGLTDLIIRGMNISGAGIFETDWNPEDSLVAPGDSLALQVSFTPVQAVFYDETLEIVNSAVNAVVALQGTGLLSSVEYLGKGAAAGTFSLHPPAPNPFNASTILSYNLQAASSVKLTVFDVNGREVALLAEDWYPAGEYEVVWNASGLPSGLYCARLTAGEFIQTRKMLLLK